MSTEQLKTKIRDAYREFVKEELQQDLGKLSDQQRSWAFTQFYLKNIHNKMRSSISEDDIEFGHVDGSNDCGVDFIQRDDNTVLIIQSKYHKPDSNVSAEEITYFQSIFQRLTNPAVPKNNKLKDALSEIDFENDNFILRFHALADISGQAKAQSQAKPPLPKSYKDLVDRVSFEFLGESELTEEYRQALSALTGIPGEHELFPYGKGKSKTPVIEMQVGDYRCCMFVVTANQLVNLYQYKGTRDALFSLNIRNFIGRTATNKAIMETAKNEPAHFFHFNNGISCLAKSFQVLDDRVKTDGLQIINGAQTVKSLVRAKSSSNWSPNSEPVVMVRIIELEKGYGEEGKFRNEVIKYNNTQNIIKLSDFRSNDTIQKDLQQKFDKLTRLGKHVQYICKRTDSLQSNSYPIRLEDFAKVTYSFLYDPISFSGNSAFLFDDSEDGGYKSAFGDGKTPWESMPDEEFRLRSAIWWMSEEFGKQLKADKLQAQDAIEKAALERKWMFLYVSRLVLERSYGEQEFRKYLIKAYRGDWVFGEQSLGKWFSELYDKSKKTLVYVYGEAHEAKDFVHRNWMRSEETLKKLRNFVMKSPFPNLPPPEQFK